MSKDRETRICRLNFCNRPIGIGTHVRLRATDGLDHGAVFQICEAHWAAIRDVPYLHPETVPVVVMWPDDPRS